MATARISISLDAADAERIKNAAASVGQGVSAFLTSVGLKEVEHRERLLEAFADADAAIQAAEAEAEELELPRDTITPEEAGRIRAEIAQARARGKIARADSAA